MATIAVARIKKVAATGFLMFCSPGRLPYLVHSYERKGKKVHFRAYVFFLSAGPTFNTKASIPGGWPISRVRHKGGSR
jgi:hypothetical protein